MKISRLVFRNLQHYWRTGIVVVFGVAVAAAVITGSLLVGDSVTASVRDAALARLGAVQYAVSAPVFFRDGLAESVRSTNSTVAGLLQTSGAVTNPDSDVVAANVNVVGIDTSDANSFWQFFPKQMVALAKREAAINQALADDLGVKVGDYVLVHARRTGEAPGDSLFASRSRNDIRSAMRVKIKKVLPNFGAGSYTLGTQSSQPRNVFLSKQWLADELDEPDRSNTMLIGGSRPLSKVQQAIKDSAEPTDLGLGLTPDDRQNYVRIESDMLLLTDAQVQAIRQAAKNAGGRAGVTSVYLADTIRKKGGGETAYAVVGGIEPLQPLPLKDGEYGDAGIVLDSWVAEDMGASVGDAVELAYRVPRADGTYETRTREFQVTGITKMEGPAADPGLVPEFKGITEADSVSDWDPPFPIDLGRVRPRDEEYWSKYRAAPKAFLPLDVLKDMWQADESARSNWITSVRVQPPAGTDARQFKPALAGELRKKLDPATVGLAAMPVRKRVLNASQGTQDYKSLFVSMSMFLVAAAVGLAGMLMRLSVQQRASEAGILLACGFTNKMTMRSLQQEGTILAVAGTMLGVPLGIGYARGMISLLESGWFGSIGEAQIWLHVNALTLGIGAVVGVAAGLGATWWGIRKLRRTSVLNLLAGWKSIGILLAPGRKGAASLTAGLALVAAPALMVGVGGTGAFFGSGAALLVGGLAVCYLLLVRVLQQPQHVSTTMLITRSAASNRGRSMLAIGLLASASFVVTAVAAYTRDFSHIDIHDKTSGTGGFALRAVSSIPIPYDFGTQTGREKLGFSADDQKLFENVKVYSFLLSDGEEISCLNLAKPTVPRVIGVSDRMIGRGGFTVTAPGADSQNKWQVLQDSAEPAYPVFGDADSLMWQLHKNIGDMITAPKPDGDTLRLRVAGKISSSIFAGELLMSEQNFRRAYPNIKLPRYFLIETPAGQEKQVAAALRRELGDLGLQVRGTQEILNSIIGVQNTYIATFVALGGLGVILGTVGMVVVVLRTAFERRSEYALMLATGFGKRFIARSLMVENAGLLLAGLVCGAGAALVAVAPEISSNHSNVNWSALLGLLAGIIVVGIASCAFAARAAVRGNLLDALREE